jgi:hypothetical protein
VIVETHIDTRELHYDETECVEVVWSLPRTPKESRDEWGFDYDRAIATVEGSVVANHMLRELMVAMGVPIVARGDTPEDVWRQMLGRVSDALAPPEESTP